MRGEGTGKGKGGTHIRNRQRTNNTPLPQIPKPQRIRALLARSRLQNAQRHDKIARQNHVLVPIDCQPVGGELLAEDVERAGDVLGMLGDDVVVCVCLDEAAGGGADGRWRFAVSEVGGEDTGEGELYYARREGGREGKKGSVQPR